MTTVVTIEDGIATFECGTQVEVGVELLLAAPKLLASLKECSQFFRDNDDFTEGGEFPIPDFIQNVRKVLGGLDGVEQ